METDFSPLFSKVTKQIVCHSRPAVLLEETIKSPQRVQVVLSIRPA